MQTQRPQIKIFFQDLSAIELGSEQYNTEKSRINWWFSLICSKFAERSELLRDDFPVSADYVIHDAYGVYWDISTRVGTNGFPFISEIHFKYKGEECCGYNVLSPGKFHNLPVLKAGLVCDHLYEFVNGMIAKVPRLYDDLYLFKEASKRHPSRAR